MPRIHPALPLRLTVLLAVGALAFWVALSPPAAAAQEGEGVLHRLQGTMTRSDGQPARGVWIAAHGHGDSPGEYAGQWAASDGSFDLQLRDGGYRVTIHSGTFSHCTVFGLENPDGGWRAIFSMDGRDLTGVRIVVSAREPLERPRWSRCQFDVPLYGIQGTVVGPGGEPLEGVSVRATGGPFGPSVTTPDGSFWSRFPTVRTCLSSRS